MIPESLLCPPLKSPALVPAPSPPGAATVTVERRKMKDATVMVWCPLIGAAPERRTIRLGVAA